MVQIQSIADGSVGLSGAEINLAGEHIFSGIEKAMKDIQSMDLSSSSNDWQQTIATERDGKGWER